MVSSGSSNQHASKRQRTAAPTPPAVDELTGAWGVSFSELSKRTALAMEVEREELRKTVERQVAPSVEGGALE